MTRYGVPAAKMSVTGLEFDRPAVRLTTMNGNITKKPRAKTSHGVFVKASNTIWLSPPLFLAT
jgi:hypothetical protein